MSPTTELPPAAELGLVPGLSEAELRRIYRQLARRYHPDSRGGSEEMMSHINALHDTLKKLHEAGASPQVTPEPPAARPRPAPGQTRPKPPPPPEPPPTPEATFEAAEPSLGELALTPAAQALMSEALVAAVDGWLQREHGVPRNLLRRRVALRLGRFGPVACPGLHLPERISMTRRRLRLHFGSTPAGGFNLVALPALVNDGIRLAPTGAVSVLQEWLEAGQPSTALTPAEAMGHGFALRMDGRELPVELLFEGSESDFSAGLERLTGRRFRGMFAPVLAAE